MTEGRVDVDRLLESEAACESWLWELCFGEGGAVCPCCGRKEPYRQEDGRLRCRVCDCRFTMQRGRWLGTCSLRAPQWLALLAAFANYEPAGGAARAAGCSANTARKALTSARLAVAARTCALLFHPASAFHYAPGSRGKMYKPWGEPPVFGLKEKNGRAHVAPLTDLTPGTVDAMGLASFCLGSFCVASAFRGFEALVFCRREEGALLGEPDVAGCSAATREFIGFLDRHMQGFRGVSPEFFPLYLLEAAARLRTGNGFFAHLAECVCARTPEFA